MATCPGSETLGEVRPSRERRERNTAGLGTVLGHPAVRGLISAGDLGELARRLAQAESQRGP